MGNKSTTDVTSGRLELDWGQAIEANKAPLLRDQRPALTPAVGGCIGLDKGDACSIPLSETRNDPMRQCWPGYIAGLTIMADEICAGADTECFAVFQRQWPYCGRNGTKYRDA